MKSHLLILLHSLFLLCPTQAISFNTIDNISTGIKLLLKSVITIWEIVNEVVDGPMPFNYEDQHRVVMENINNLAERIENIKETIHIEQLANVARILYHITKRLKVELRMNDLVQHIHKVHSQYKQLMAYTKHRSQIENSTLKNFADNVVSHSSNSVRSLLHAIHQFIVSDIEPKNNLVNLMSDKELDSSISENDFLQVLDPIGRWGSVEQKILKANVMYNTFKRFQTQQTGQNRVPSPIGTWIGFTKAILPSIPNLLKEIQEDITAIELLKKIKELDTTSLCVAKQSPNQLLYNLYNTIALTEMKGYAMIQFSYMLLKLYGQGNYTKESEIEREHFIERTIATAKKMQEAMKSASRELWRCDPEKHVEGETYIEITQLLQGYLQNEVDLNGDGTCWENCAAYQYTKSHSCYKNLYCRQQRRCQGKILNCKFVKSDMWVCPSANTMKRRYEYVEYENGQIYGKKGSCPKGRIEVDSWWRWLFWHCSYCMCLCDEEGIFSDRYFSMKSSLADIKNNRVITGIKFTKIHRIIHFQIQQGQLLPEGVINKTTVEWVPVDSFRLNDRHVQKDQTYFTLSWDNRAIDLDVLQASDGYALTGVRFQKIGSHLNLQIYVTPFDYITGQLKPDLSEWIDNTNTEFSTFGKRKRINLKDTDIPTRTNNPSEVKSTHNEFLEFTHTSFELDAAQTTVPFLDSQPVISNSIPNSGAGIYYKSSGNGIGGFIGIKLVNFDYSEHLIKKIDLEEEPEIN